MKFFPQLCFKKILNHTGLGRVIKRVLASVSVGCCVSVQEVHSICLQHDLLNLTYLSTASVRNTHWMKDEWWWVKLGLCHLSSVVCGQGVVWIKEGLCHRGGPYKIYYDLIFQTWKPDIKFQKLLVHGGIQWTFTVSVIVLIKMT